MRNAASQGRERTIIGARPRPDNPATGLLPAIAGRSGWCYGALSSGGAIGFINRVALPLFVSSWVTVHLGPNLRQHAVRRHGHLRTDPAKVECPMPASTASLADGRPIKSRPIRARLFTVPSLSSR